MLSSSNSGRFQRPPLRRGLRPSELLKGHFTALANRIRDWAGERAEPVAVGVGGIRRGSGASTVALNLAAALARVTARPAGIVETDFGNPVLTAGGRRFCGLSEVLRGECSADSCFQELPSDRVVVLGPGRQPAGQAFELNFDLVRPMLLESFSHCSFVLFDLPPLGGPLGGFPLLGQLAGVLAVLDSTGVGQQEAQRLRRELERYRVDLTGIVLNKMEPGRS